MPGDTNARCDNDLDGRFEENCSDIFVHDRLTGFTRRVSLGPGGAQGDRGSLHPALAADGETIAFESAADNLVAGDDNAVCDLDRDGVAAENCEDVFVAEPDPAAAQDRNGDGDVRDTLLLRASIRAVDQPTPLAIAAADQVAVFGSCAVFLSPEASQGAGVDLNGDGDAADRVVQLACRADAGGVQLRNLRRAAAQVALSDRVVAARVVEADQGGADLNGDGDVDDTVLQVAERSQPDEWTNTGEPADVISASGAVVAFLTPEAPGRDLNGDGDTEDRVLQLWFAGGGGDLVNTGQAAEEFVLGDHSSLLAPVRRRRAKARSTAMPTATTMCCRSTT